MAAHAARSKNTRGVKACGKLPAFAVEEPPKPEPESEPKSELLAKREAGESDIQIEGNGKTRDGRWPHSPSWTSPRGLSGEFSFMSALPSVSTSSIGTMVSSWPHAHHALIFPAAWRCAVGPRLFLGATATFQCKVPATWGATRCSHLMRGARNRPPLRRSFRPQALVDPARLWCPRGLAC